MKLLFFICFLVCIACEQNPKPNSTSTLSSMEKKTSEIYGLTLDNVENLDAIVDSLRSMPKKPWVRIVFDYPVSANKYIAAVNAISPYAEIIGQPADSTYLAKMSVSQYSSRFQSYVNIFPQINIWETCNECNGSWAGKNTALQAHEATRIVKLAGKKTLFTPYWNTNDCADSNGNYISWTEKNISSFVKENSDYVMISIYGHDCNNGPEPSYQELNSMISTFAIMFPSAKIGIGEYGKKGNAAIMKHYLNYKSLHPQFLFFGGYWYGYQDLVPKTKQLYKIFTEGML